MEANGQIVSSVSISIGRFAYAESTG